MIHSAWAGRRYAANVLVFPYGDWCVRLRSLASVDVLNVLVLALTANRLGTVQEVDVPRVLDEVLAWHGVHRRTTSDSDSQSARSLPPLCPPYWRGRMGLDTEEQLALASQLF